MKFSDFFKDSLRIFRQTPVAETSFRSTLRMEHKNCYSHISILAKMLSTKCATAHFVDNIFEL